MGRYSLRGNGHVLHRQKWWWDAEPAQIASGMRWSRDWRTTLAWKIPWMEKPGGLQSMGLLRVRHD